MIGRTVRIAVAVTVASVGAACFVDASAASAGTPKPVPAAHISSAAAAAAKTAVPQQATSASKLGVKSPRVTVTVIGKLPTLSGPVDHYTQDGASFGSQVVTPAYATLPYSFTLSGVWSLYGRTFRSTKTTVCTDIEVTYSDHGQGYDFEVELDGAWTGNIPIDGVARSYCWSPIPTNTDQQFYYHVRHEPNPGSYTKVNGSGDVRYP